MALSEKNREPKTRTPLRHRAATGHALSIWLSAAAALAASVGVAYAGRPVHESLASVAVRAQHIVVAEIVAADESDDEAEHSIDIEATPEQVIAGPALENGMEETLTCRYSEERVQHRGDAVVSPLVSGSGEEFRIRRGDRVILLLAAQALTAAPPDAPSQSAPDDEQLTQSETLDCRLLRVESLQNRIAILRFLRQPTNRRPE
ncbi:MAG: hypothetical protein JNN30_11710 [Rhodanobacteraceae bacterium]|nr:hypothetical protein [Rhodanobacteraceae bacterium]